MKTKKIAVPPLPFGVAPTYFDSRSFSLAGLNKSFNMTPREAKPYQSHYIDRGCTTVNINAGYGEYTQLARANRSVFLGPEYIQDANGGKYFRDYTLDDCRRAARYAWNRAGGYGIITSGAQEGRGGFNFPEFPNGDPYATLPLNSLNAYVNLSQAWGEVMAENALCHYFGAYDGTIYFNPFDDPAALRTALSSDANALAYLKAHTYGPNPYWQQELWRFHDVLVNLYFRSGTDLHAKHFEVQMVITLTKMALRAVGRSDRRVMVFVFPGKTEFVDYPGHGYSELYIRDLPGGGTYEEYNFPNYAFSHQWEQCFCALDQADDYYGWEDTVVYGQNPAVVEPDQFRDDGFQVRTRKGGDVSVVQNGPTPYNPSSAYAFFSSYNGHTDIGPCAAEMYAKVCAYAGQNSQFARHRRAGTSTWCSLDSAYILDRFLNREATVRVARQGTRGWIKITDNAYDLVDPYDLEVDLGSGDTGTFKVDSCAVNLYTFDTAA